VKKTILLSLLTLLLVGGMLLPACSSSTQDNTQVFCDSLAALAKAEANVRSINASTTVDQANQYRQDLKNAWNDTVNAKKNLTVSKYNDLEASYNELASSLNGLEGSQTVAEALPSIQSAMATFDANLNEIRTTTCSFTPTSSP
jgi:hypothetical protein